MVPEKFVLSNGIRVVLTPMQGTEAVTVLVLTKAGARCENIKTNGIAHFQEHVFFKGGKRYKNARAVSEAADNLGARFNAYTGYEQACYYIQCAGSHIEKALDILSDMILNATFDEKEIEKERGVVLEEINRKLDNPGSQIWTDWFSLFFGNQPLGRPVLGPPKNIKRFTRDDFFGFRKRFCANSNIVISVAGNCGNPTKMLAMLEKYFLAKKENRASAWKAFDDSKVRTNGATQLRQQNIQQANFVLGMPGFREKDRLTPATQILSSILGRGMSSRLFLSVREKQGLCYTIFNSCYGFTDTGILATYAGVTIEKIEQAVSSVLKEYDKIKRQGITEKELKKVKNMFEGKFALDLEDSLSVAECFGDQELLYGEMETPRQMLDKYQAVSCDDVNHVASMLIDPKKMSLAIIGPFDDPKRFEKLL